MPKEFTPQNQIKKLLKQLGIKDGVQQTQIYMAVIGKSSFEEMKRDELKLLEELFADLLTKPKEEQLLALKILLHTND